MATCIEWLSLVAIINFISCVGVGNVDSDTADNPPCTALPSDTNTSVLSKVTCTFPLSAEEVSDEESLGSEVEEDYSCEAIGDVHSLVYGHADVTVFQSYLLVFQYSMKHSLTKSALSDLLQLIKVHLPQNTSYLSSVHQMKEFFTKLLPHATPLVHQYCSYCLSALPSNGACAMANCPGTTKGQFITIPLTPQLKRIFEGVYIIILLATVIADAVLLYYNYVYRQTSVASSARALLKTWSFQFHMRCV